MKIFLFSLMCVIVCSSCNEVKELKIDPSNSAVVNSMESNEYLIFGTYSGFCIGDCVTLFKLTNKVLYKETSGKRPYQEGFFEGEFMKLPAIDHSRVSVLFGEVNPLEGKKSGKTYGCPDCADQGGIYVEYGKGDKKVKGYLDTNIEALPAELKEHATLIIGLVSELREK
ncbi:MAG: hypothetical protein K0U54_04935 [Bacteroidetes bacterium]|nr:hypothetical protein [Bacteroidota bacterium]